jgi:hypothetical protein
MRTGLLLLAAAVVVAGMAPGGARAADRATCEAAFRAYDNAVWLFPDNQFDEDRPVLRPDIARAAQRLIREGCLTRSADLDGMPALAQRLAPFTIVDSGPAIRPATVELGIVTGIWDEARATAFFRGLGYRSRGIGAETLGRRLFIGPFTSQGALDQALAVAREAGFIAPHVAPHTRF